MISHAFWLTSSPLCRLTALGVAMLGTPAFGKCVGWLSVVIRVAGVAAGVVLLIDPGSPIAAVSVLSLIIFHLVLGWKVSRLSRGSVGALDDRGNGVRTAGESNPIERSRS